MLVLEIFSKCGCVVVGLVNINFILKSYELILNPCKKECFDKFEDNCRKNSCDHCCANIYIGFCRISQNALISSESFELRIK